MKYAAPISCILMLLSITFCSCSCLLLLSSYIVSLIVCRTFSFFPVGDFLPVDDKSSSSIKSWYYGLIALASIPLSLAVKVYCKLQIQKCTCSVCNWYTISDSSWRNNARSANCRRQPHNYRVLCLCVPNCNDPNRWGDITTFYWATLFKAVEYRIFSLRSWISISNLMRICQHAGRL